MPHLTHRRRQHPYSRPQGSPRLWRERQHRQRQPPRIVEILDTLETVCEALRDIRARLTGLEKEVKEQSTTLDEALKK